MDAKPIAKYNSRNELYFQCPNSGCEWTFQFAVARVGESQEMLPVLFQEQLDKEFAEHIRAAHSKPATR